MSTDHPLPLVVLEHLRDVLDWLVNFFAGVKVRPAIDDLDAPEFAAGLDVLVTGEARLHRYAIGLSRSIVPYSFSLVARAVTTFSGVSSTS